MFQLSSCGYIASLLALLGAMTSCGHSNPQIKGENSTAVRVKVMSAAPSASGISADAYSGTIEAGSSTALSFSVAGTIKGIYVQEGQRVAKGQKVASVDGASLAHANEIAQAALREAQDAYNRLKKLHEASALPDMQWVAAQENLKQAQAAAAIAQKGMDDASISSPISGVVAHKIADVGQTVAPGIPVVEIMDVTTLKAQISVPEKDLAQMKEGTKAVVSAGGRNYDATLIEKGVAANPLSRNYEVKFRISNPDASLLPGMICNVEIEGAAPKAEEQASAGITLPPQAVVLDWDNSSYVWVKKDGKALRKKVEVGGLNSRGIVVAGGLASTDSVIVEGQQKLSSGLNVESVN